MTPLDDLIAVPSKRQKSDEMSSLRTHVEESVIIDGSILEGGGQILRNASALAAINGKTIAVEKIRAARSRPGLMPQHLTGLNLIQALSGGVLLGGYAGSTSINFMPKKLRMTSNDTLEADTKTAGSCTLLAQAALPCLLFTQPPSTQHTLRLKGGTDAPMAPPVGYMQHVLRPLLVRKLGLEITLDLMRRGFYPKGGGILEVTARSLPENGTIPAFKLTNQGTICSIEAFAFVAGHVKESIGQRLLSAAQAVLQARFPNYVYKAELVRETATDALGDGCGILLVAKSDTGCILGSARCGEKGVSAESIGKMVALELSDVLETGACVDDYLQDQLIIWMALAKGTSEFVCGEPTLHTRTAIEIAQTLTSACFSIIKEKGRTWIIRCNGAGIKMM